MSDAERFRDSTQIVLPVGALDGLRRTIERDFTLTLHEQGDALRIIGSPVEIKEASDWLARKGVFVP
ncbi:VNG_1110C family protein [Halomarina ordinaria]|uniref:AbrB/MazE/SpoVT family DNA-binding domain-containing protein n=1 Tax=Halomarina ordinaria TaxID=3033939 RepID=A0ABD5U6K3_9EURY|nr:hypothetical protein [Halomarina sp. PSRA2]